MNAPPPAPAGDQRSDYLPDFCESRAVLTVVLVSALLAVVLALAAAPAGAADMNKVIRHVFPVGEEGFDPAASSDLYSGTVNQAVFETLLTYDYLARPSKLVPLAAEALPQVTIACADSIPHGVFVEVLDITKANGAQTIAVIGR